jgi:hypothetical protein
MQTFGIGWLFNLAFKMMHATLEKLKAKQFAQVFNSGFFSFRFGFFFSLRLSLLSRMIPKLYLGMPSLDLQMNLL